MLAPRLEWEKQGKQRPMGVEPSETGQDTKLDTLSSLVETVTESELEDNQSEMFPDTKVTPQLAPAPGEDQPKFFTQAERASLADVDERTQRRSDRYEQCRARA